MVSKWLYLGLRPVVRPRITSRRLGAASRQGPWRHPGRRNGPQYFLAHGAMALFFDSPTAKTDPLFIFAHTAKRRPHMFFACDVKKGEKRRGTDKRQQASRKLGLAHGALRIGILAAKVLQRTAARPKYNHWW